MKRPTLLVAAALAGAILPGVRWAGPGLLGRAQAADSAAGQPPADDLEQLLPQVDFPALAPEQRQMLAQVLANSYCYCGCPHTLGGCLRVHKACRHSGRMGELAAYLIEKGLGAPETSQALTQYYASFDKAKRAKLDTKGFGPPLGSSKAPVTMVEFSDYGCPYCQMLRPQLEKFVQSHKDRVKFFSKPFPLQGHEHSFEAASANEWARDKGFYWKMHDLLFTRHTALAPNDLAAYAKELGGDPADLRKALETERYKPRILASQAEARAAGLTATPTLFFNGRRFTLPVLSPWLFEFTLEDEEEWQKNGGGWDKD